MVSFFFALVLVSKFERLPGTPLWGLAAKSLSWLPDGFLGVDISLRWVVKLPFIGNGTHHARGSLALPCPDVFVRICRLRRTLSMVGP